ncbi:MAG: hypothetical protein ACRDMV_05570, partial [Streptosporangiales bacterium]
SERSDATSRCGVARALLTFEENSRTDRERLMTQPGDRGWQAPDRPNGDRHHPDQGPPPSDWYGQLPSAWPEHAPPPRPHAPAPPRPVAPPPYAGPPLPPPVPPGRPMPPGAPGWVQPAAWRPAPPPRRVAPPVPVPDAQNTGHPPPPKMQLPPAPGYQTEAPELPTAKRVPDDLPLVIRPRVSRWILLFVTGLLAVVVVPTTVVLASTGWPAALLTLVGTLLGYTLLCSFVIYTQASGGPLLSADRDGVWIRARKWPVKAVRVPWELIAEIRTKRWLVEKVLCVVPRDDRVGRFNDLWSAGDQMMNSAYFGTPLTASVVYGDTSEGEALRRLAELSAGRSRINVPFA